jgi:hypothetical protein
MRTGTSIESGPESRLVVEALQFLASGRIDPLNDQAENVAEAE